MRNLVVILVAFFVQTATSFAQTVEQLVGVWTVVTIENIKADGTRSPAFGDNPHTQLILTANGRFSQIFVRSDIPKFASGSRLTGTPEENAAVVKGSNTSFGTFTLEGNVVSLKMEGTTFPNWIGTVQKRPIVRLSADELVWQVAGASGGGSIETVWKRVK